MRGEMRKRKEPSSTLILTRSTVERALDPLILRRGGEEDNVEDEEEEDALVAEGAKEGSRGRRTEGRSTAGQTTPALLEHADTVAKARLHHPTGIDTSIVPLRATGWERRRSECRVKDEGGKGGRRNRRRRPRRRRRVRRGETGGGAKEPTGYVCRENTGAF